MASWAVHRPSPESATTPEMSSTPAPGRVARSISWSSQLRPTEPYRQIEAISWRSKENSSAAFMISNPSA